MPEQIRNWAGNVAFEVAQRVRPQSVDELVQLLRANAQRGQRSKAAGAGYSRSEIIETTGTQIDMSAFRVLEVSGPERGWVRVGAGIRIAELCRFLAQQGLGLLNQPSVAELGCVGAMATGSHGSGLAAALASRAVRIQLVDGRGRLHELSRDTGGDVFRACAVGLGLMGVITEVTMEVVAAFAVEEVTERWSIERAFDEQLCKRAAEDDYHQYYWLPHTEQALVFRRNRVSAAPEGAVLRPPLPRRERAASTVALAVGAVCPRWIPAINRMGQGLLYDEHRRVARSSAILAVELPNVFQELEYALPAAAAAGALAEVRQLFGEHRHVANYPVIVRFAAADGLLMSPAFGRDSVYISVSCSTLQLVSRFRTELDERMAAHRARPHWGKLFGAGAAQLRLAYADGYDRFMAVMRELDPDALLENRFSQRCFPR
jgi:FAD/FMN-containing dehydrogenase